MIRPSFENQFIQAKFKSFLAEPAQKFFLYMAESNSTKYVKRCVELGEKTILPFVDDVITAVWCRIQQKSEATEDKWIKSSKKDLKMCKGFLNGLIKTSTKSGMWSETKASSALILATVMVPPNAKSSTCFKAKPCEPDTFRKRSSSLKTRSLRMATPYSHPFIKRLRTKATPVVDEEVYPVLKILLRSFSKKVSPNAQIQLLKYRIARLKNLVDSQFGMNASKGIDYQTKQRTHSTVEAVVKSALILNDYGMLINKRKGTDSMRPRSFSI